jgi:hypothetical protein
MCILQDEIAETKRKKREADEDDNIRQKGKCYVK